MQRNPGGRPPRRLVAARRKRFVGLLATGMDPYTAARESGHPAERALETLRDLGFTLTVLGPNDFEKEAA